MYTLYDLQGSCSIATPVVLHELDQAVNIIDVMKLENFKEINPIGAVPVLIDGDKIKAMLDAVKKMPSYQKTIEAEQIESAKLVNE